MKNCVISFIIAAICLLLLAACGSGLPEVSLPPEPSAAESAPPETPDADAAVLDECLGLLGLDHEAAKAALGGGTENLAADGETLIGCVYSAEFFGEATQPSTLYDAQGLVCSVSVYLSGADAAPYAGRLTELYGEPDADSAGASAESGSSWEVWKTERGQLKLVQNYGLCTLEITPPAEGLG